MMKLSDQTDKFLPAFGKAYLSMRPMPRDAKNPHFNNTYISLDAMTEVVRAACLAHDIVVSHSSSIDGGVLNVETVAVHVGSGQWMSNTCAIPLAKLDPQASGGALTYGRRYGLSSMFAIVSDEDDDGNTASGKDYRTPLRTSVSPSAREPAPPMPAREATTTRGGSTLPFGKTKGTPLSEMPVSELESALKWAQDKGKFVEFQAQAVEELEARRDD